MPTDPEVTELLAAIDTATENAAPAGPYMNEDGDWWVPVAAMPFYEARAYVRTHSEAPRLAYLGREEAWLDSKHEGYCGPECETNRKVLAWHFEERGVR